MIFKKIYDFWKLNLSETSFGFINPPFSFLFSAYAFCEKKKWKKIHSIQTSLIPNEFLLPFENRKVCKFFFFCYLGIVLVFFFRVLQKFDEIYELEWKEKTINIISEQWKTWLIFLPFFFSKVYEFSFHSSIRKSNLLVQLSSVCIYIVFSNVHFFWWVFFFLKHQFL